MARSVSFKEFKIDQELNDIFAWAEKLRKEREYQETMELYQNQDYIFKCFFEENHRLSEEYSSFAKKHIQGIFWEEVQPKYTDLDTKLKKLLMLLARIKTASLGRILIDFKSMFRTKVPLLFKNLDDAHIANLIPALPRISFSYKPNQHPKKWDLRTYRRHYALHQTY